MGDLKKEAAALKQRLRGTMFYVSVKYFEKPEVNEDGSRKLDDFGMQVKTLMKSVAPPYRNQRRQFNKRMRHLRAMINRAAGKGEITQEQAVQHRLELMSHGQIQ